MAIKTWKELISTIDPTLDASKIVLTQISASLELPDGRKLDLPIRADSTIESIKAAMEPAAPSPTPTPSPAETPTVEIPKITGAMREFSKQFFDSPDDRKEFLEFALFDDKAKQFFRDVPNPVAAYDEEYQATPGMSDLEKFQNFLNKAKPAPATSTEPPKVEPQPTPAPSLTSKPKAGKGKKTKKQ